VCVCSLIHPARRAHSPYYIVICGVSDYDILRHYLINSKIFGKKKSYWTQNVCSDCLCNFRLKHFSFCEDLSKIWSNMYIGLHVQYPLFLSYFKKAQIFSTVFRKILKYQISWKSVQWEPSCPKRTDGHEKKPMVVFFNFVNASKTANYPSNSPNNIRHKTQQTVTQSQNRGYPKPAVW
jgi:hypothetical protein